MKRAAFVRRGAAGLVVAPSLAGLLRTPAAFAQAGARVRPLTPVAVALDRVTRTTVGLRPYRPSGFVLRAEARDRKTIVHDYGHGGGGMTLSWGTALLARDLALRTEKRVAAVIGSGVIGLTTARVLQDAGFTVTIYARDVPPNTTSNMSGAQWTPTSLFDHDRALDPVFRSQYVEAAMLAYRRYQTLLGEDYGVRWIENYDCHDDPQSPFLRSNATLLPDAYPRVTTFGPGEHPFPTRYATRFLTMLIEPNRYLRALQRDVLLRGGRIVVRSFATIADVMALDEPLVMNCTGLGAKELFGDAELEPVRGQLSVLDPQPAVDYITFASGYMFPRSDGIVLGGTFEHGATSLVPDPATIRRIVRNHAAFFGAMRTS